MNAKDKPSYGDPGQPPGQLRSNVLFVDVDPNPVVDLIYEPDPYTTPVRLRLRVFESSNTFTFPGGSAQTLYIPQVELASDPVTPPSSTAYRNIETRLDPDDPNSVEAVPTMTVFGLGALPDRAVRHRLLSEPPTAAPVTIPSSDVTDYTAGRNHVRFDVSAPGVSFSCFWKQIASGVDPSGPRDFFLQV